MQDGWRWTPLSLTSCRCSYGNCHLIPRPRGNKSAGDSCRENSSKTCKCQNLPLSVGYTVTQSSQKQQLPLHVKGYTEQRTKFCLLSRYLWVNKSSINFLINKLTSKLYFYNEARNYHFNTLSVHILVYTLHMPNDCL